MSELFELLKLAGSVAIYCLILVIAIDKLKLELNNRFTELELRIQKLEIAIGKRYLRKRHRKDK